MPAPSAGAARMRRFFRDGLVFDVVDSGPGAGDVVLLLHGFPQTASSWSAVADRLNAAGFRTIAPDQRGYSPGARPPGRSAYVLAELVADAAALIESAAAGPVHIVGHDWGAIVAWALVAERPGLVHTVTGVSVPHPAAMQRAVRSSLQAVRSWYVLALQVPVLPELLLRRPRRVERLLRRAGQSPDPAARDANRLAGALHGPIAWYRALPLARSRRLPAPVRRPALLVWGAHDPFVSRAAVLHNAAFMADRHRLVVLPDAGHWIPDQDADRLARLVLDHIAAG